MNMTRKQIVFLIALGAFIVSFLLPAVRMARFPEIDLPGYLCAVSALLSPWDKDSAQELAAKPGAYFAVLCSGLINPLFLAAVALLRGKKTERFGKSLRIAVLCLLPACWLYFWVQKMYPHVGYFLWVAAIIVALYSSSPRRDRFTKLAEVEPKKSGPEKPQELPLTQLSWTTE
jgi:CDP-diglyceride synthetase